MECTDNSDIQWFDALYFWVPVEIILATIFTLEARWWLLLSIHHLRKPPLIFEVVLLMVTPFVHYCIHSIQILARLMVARSPASHLIGVGMWFNIICVAPFYIELAISVVRQETLDFTISTTDSPLLTSVKLIKVVHLLQWDFRRALQCCRSLHYKLLAASIHPLTHEYISFLRYCEFLRLHSTTKVLPCLSRRYCWLGENSLSHLAYSWFSQSQAAW